MGHAWGRVAFSALTRNHSLPVSFRWNPALIPEEAESALEATQYFTEDSPSEGERATAETPSTTSLCGLQPPVFPRGLCRKPAVPLWAQGACHPGALPGRALQHFLGQVVSVDVLNLCFSCLSVSLDLGFSLCPLRILCCPFQHLLWPQIWIFSCPGRRKVSPWRAGAAPLPLGFVFLYSEAWKLSCPGDSLEPHPVGINAENNQEWSCFCWGQSARDG